jgi:hypothetical protein
LSRFQKERERERERETYIGERGDLKKILLLKSTIPLVKKNLLYTACSVITKKNK